MTKPFLTIIPYNVRNDKRLTSNEKLFYGDLVGLAQNEGYCYAENKWFVETFEVSERTIRNWLENLENCGYIKRHFDQQGGRKIYVLQGFQKNISKEEKKFRGVGKNFPPEYINTDKENILEEEEGVLPNDNFNEKETKSNEQSSSSEKQREKKPPSEQPPPEITPQEREIILKNNSLLEKESIYIAVDDQLAMIRYAGAEIFRKAANAAMTDWIYNKKRIKSFEAILWSKLKKLKKDRDYYKIL